MLGYPLFAALACLVHSQGEDHPVHLGRLTDLSTLIPTAL
jgi:hypothetical protein